MVEYTPIGIIRSGFTDKKNTPIQSIFVEDAMGEVEIFPEYVAGLKNIDRFSHIILIYHFHLSKNYSLFSKTCLEDEKHGIFAMRQSQRPNPIGISTVRLSRVMGNILSISEVDVVDGSPLLDIKPFVPVFDNRRNATNGWLGQLHIHKVIKESVKRQKILQTGNQK
ncbi:MAG: tRNA (N6-threonylcarbamoyladenosine(37)-N6)-methyltransferase TrmO [Deltaproteobacteria bacterium]|nr:tRNA (N6-threonylcarbamoyladenosine(37)-N6)-methyltransferase TrmO [Deltaproteobacteria bacterium]